MIQQFPSDKNVPESTEVTNNEVTRAVTGDVTPKHAFSFKRMHTSNFS